MAGKAKEVAAGRRPPDRRKRIIESAAELFAERGYQAVTTQDIADREGITAGALYRHFSSKAELLFAIFDEYFRRGAPTDRDFESLDDMIAARVISTSTAPFLGPLWSQESRQLEAARHAELSRQLRTEFARWAVMVERDRSDLTAAQAELVGMTLTAVLTSSTQSFKGLRQAEKLDLVATACRSVAAVSWSTDPSADRPDRSLPSTGPERVLVVAIDEFGRNGYDDTSLSAIGRGAGMTAASIYGHYENKSVLWAAALERTRHLMWLELNRALDGQSPETRLRAVVHGYAKVLESCPRLAAALTTGAQPADSSNADYLQEWVHLLRSATNASQARASASVTTAVAVMNSLAATPDVLMRPDFVSALTAVGSAVLLTSS